MTVGELVASLQDYNPHHLVVINVGTTEMIPADAVGDEFTCEPGSEITTRTVIIFAEPKS